MRVVFTLLACFALILPALPARADLEYIPTGTLYGPWNSARDVAVSNGYAYVACGDSTMQGDKGIAVVELNAPEQMIYRGYVEHVTDVNALAIEGNRLYAAASANGLYIYDISDPVEPELLGHMAILGPALSLQVRQQIVYVGFGGDANPCGVRIIDASDPTSPVSLGIATFDTPAKGLKIRYPTLYVAAGSGGLKLLNVSNPVSPVLLSTLSGFIDAGSVDVYEDYAYVGDTVGWIGVVNVLNAGNVYQEYTYDTLPGVGSIKVWSDYADALICFADQSSMRMLSLDNPAVPAEIASLPIDTELNTEPRLTYDSHTAYLANGTYGLHSFDVNNPDDPEPIASFYGMSQLMDVSMDGSTIFAADRMDGLRILSVDDVDNPVELSALSHNFNRFIVDGDVGYGVAAGAIHSIDLSDLSDPDDADEEDLAGPGLDLALRNGIAAVADGTHGIALFEADGDQLSPLGTFTLQDNVSADAVDIYGQYAVVISESGGLFLLDIQDPGSIQLAGVYDGDLVTPRDVTISDSGVIYIAYGYTDGFMRSGGLYIFTVSGTTFELLSQYTQPRIAYSVNLTEDVFDLYARLSNGSDGVTTLDVDDSYNPVLVNQLDEAGDAYAVDMEEMTMAVASLDRIRLYSMAYVGVDKPTAAKPVRDFHLLPAWPNPFNAETRVTVTLDQPGRLQIAVYDLLGREVTVLTDREYSAGQHSFRFDAGRIASGSYWLRAIGPSGESTNQRITLVR